MPNMQAAYQQYMSGTDPGMQRLQDYGAANAAMGMTSGDWLNQMRLGPQSQFGPNSPYMAAHLQVPPGAMQALFQQQARQGGLQGATPGQAKKKAGRGVPQGGAANRPAVLSTTKR